MVEIKRDQYLNWLIKKKDNGRVKIITGIRRCGKSYLLFQIFRNYLIKSGIDENQIVELRLDEIENVRYRNPFEMNDFVKERIGKGDLRYYVFIDEIQFCEEVRNPYSESSETKVTFVDALLGLMKYKNVDIYITGSNSKMLSKDILTQFRDRGDEIHLMPLSFAEYWDAYKLIHGGMVFPTTFPVDFQMPDKNEAWRDYCTFGGMPHALFLNTTEERSRYLKDLFEETYIRDILERNDIRNDKETMEVLLDFIASAIGSLTNPAKLEKRFLSVRKTKLSHNTIARYLDYFTDAYLITQVKRYDIKGAKYFDTPLKYYYTDIGLRNARLNFRQVEENHIMENIIYNDLIRRGYNVDVGVVSHSKWEKEAGGKDKKVRVQLEVDFVVNQGNKRYYIQSALHVDTKEKMEQETNSLCRIGDSFGKIVIVKDNIIPWHDEKGILYVGVLDFLLNEKILEENL